MEGYGTIFKQQLKRTDHYILIMETVLFDTNMMKGNSLKFCDPDLEKPLRIARVNSKVPVNPLSPSKRPVC